MNGIGRSRLSTGIALLELAIVAPVLVFIFVIFWETLVDIMSRIRHESAAVQLSNLFRRSPLRISTQTVGGETSIDIVELSPNELYDEGDPAGLLPSFHTAFLDIMANAGTGASNTVNNIALSLFYVDVCTDTTGVCAGKRIGDAASHHPAINPSGDEVRFYLPRRSVECFGDPGSPFRERIERELYNFSEEKLAQLYSAGSKPLFGKKIIDIVTPPLQLGSVLAYLPARPIMFWAMCSVPPRFLEREPVITYHTFFFPAEVGIG